MSEHPCAQAVRAPLCSREEAKGGKKAEVRGGEAPREVNRSLLSRGSLLACTPLPTSAAGSASRDRELI